MLCIGGAISLDRAMHLQEIWMRKIKRKSEIMIYWEKEFQVYDELLTEDIKNERVVMDNIYTRLKVDIDSLKYWLYGYFNDSNSEIISDICFSLLNIEELRRLI